MNKKKIIVFAACLAVLLALQIKLLQPWLMDVASSDLFLEESQDLANPMAISNDMTALAFSHCNNYITKQLNSEHTASFSNQPTNAWSIGNYEYILNAEIDIATKETPSTIHHYVCRIQYKKGDDLSGSNDFENWSVEGLTGIPDL